MFELNLFQWLTLPVLLLLLLGELRGLVRRGWSWLAVVRSAVWLAAGVLIADPMLTQRVADLVGITRGADLVFYATALAFLGVTFYFYTRHVKTERKITELVRHIAIERAQRGGPERPGSTTDASAKTV